VDASVLERKFQRAQAKIENLESTIEDRTRELYLANVDLTERNRELQDLRGELLQVSHLAGMSEVATGVMHNIGNVMNSVNVSVNVLHEALQKSSVRLLGKIAALLAEQSTDATTLAEFLTSDPRGQRFSDSLSAIAERLAHEQSNAVEELSTVREHLQHIIAIISSQQDFARKVEVRERIDLGPFLDKAIILGASRFRQNEIQIEKHYGDIPTLTVNAPKLMQIIVNLLSNARHAIVDGNPDQKVVEVRTHLNCHNTVVITVTDTGVGIPQENLPKIFEHGFTTKEKGHGFGLHISALAAEEMGGSLVAHSEGHGTGATFTLTVPVEAKGPHHA
jgi:signal transduction histidine kinase